MQQFHRLSKGAAGKYLRMNSQMDDAGTECCEGEGERAYSCGLENYLKEMGSNLRNLKRPSVSPAENKNEQRPGDTEVLSPDSKLASWVRLENFCKERVAEKPG